MIINCPACGARISNKHPRCPECNANLAEVEAGGLDVEEARKRQRRLRRSRLEMQSYLAILILVAGASWMYLSSDYLQQPPTFWPTATLAVGAIWYLVVRVYGIVMRNR